MKKLLSVACLLTVVLTAQAQTEFDFSAVNAEGVSLYYRITDETLRKVELTSKKWRNIPNAYQTYSSR